MNDILWAPSRERAAASNANAFLRWLRAVRGRDLAGWPQLWRWWVEDLAGFWDALGDYARPAATSLAVPEDSPRPNF